MNLMKTYLAVFALLFLITVKTNAQVPEITENTTTVLGMVLMNKMELMDYPNIEKDIVSTWDVEKENIDGNDQTISFSVNGATFLIGFIPAPVPGDELNSAVEYSYLWKDARAALRNESHIVIAVVGEESPLDLYKHFTKITAIILENTNSMGVYMGNQGLVLSKEFYLEEAATMNDENLPLPLWVYIGMRQNDQGSSVYTYGLKEFGLKEMEIVNSEKTMEEAFDFIHDAAHYVIAGQVELNDGETMGMSEDQKINISISNGVNLEGQTLKLAY